MRWIINILYFLALIPALPFLFYKSRRTGKYRSGWAGRLGRVDPHLLGKLRSANGPNEMSSGGKRPRRILLHCVSVGELLSMRPLINELVSLDSRLKIVVSTTTDTGLARAADLYAAQDSSVVPVRYPLDLSFAVDRFLDTIRPDLIVLVELETWPNFIFTAVRRGIPIRIINGRLTERSFRRYRLIRPVVAAMFRRIKRFGVQTEPIARRFIALGAPAERVDTIATVKYDAADFSMAIPGTVEFAAALGIRPDHLIVVGGSTGPGEESALLDMYQRLSPDWPQLRLAIAPRKPETVAAVRSAIESRGLRAIYRSKQPDGAMGAALSCGDVVLLDTMGELKKLYSVALGVFSGRSLIKLGGSDMIEAAALAKPVCFGPHTFNFSQAVDVLLAAGGAVRLENAGQLEAVLRQWLEHPDAARQMGLCGRNCLLGLRGSSRRYAMEIINELGLLETDSG